MIYDEGNFMCQEYYFPNLTFFPSHNIQITNYIICDIIKQKYHSINILSFSDEIHI